MRTKVEIIDNSTNVKCNRCNGRGFNTQHHTDGYAKNIECNACLGSGIFDRERFILVAKNKDQKIAFDVDNAGK